MKKGNKAIRQYGNKESHQFARAARKFGGENKKGIKALRRYGNKISFASLKPFCKNVIENSNPLNQSENKNTLANKRLLSALWPYCPNAFKRKAFTLAEVLITLAIIGIVSALVIPSVLKNYNDKKYNTARLKALKTFGEAGKMASINGEINGQPTARAFVENVLSKYLKITKVCDNNKAQECNFPEKIQPLNPEEAKKNSNNNNFWHSLGFNISVYGWTPDIISDPNFSIYVETVDGFSAKVFYNKNCVRDIKESKYNVDEACLNVIYDMNGVKAPNHVGEDIGFVTVFWSGMNAVSVAPSIIEYSKAKKAFDKGNVDFYEAQRACAELNNGKDLYDLPNTDEMSSLYLNQLFASIPTYEFYWASSPASSNGNVWGVFYPNDRRIVHRGYSMRAWCVRR